MAELEVASHAKNAIEVIKNKEHGWKHKIKEFLFEIFIIVFAVSLSIWFHSLSEKSHERAEAKDFLIGVKSDLLQDIDRLEKDIDFVKNQQKGYRYISGLNSGEIVSEDSIAAYQKYLYRYIGSEHNNGRYEGFKSSGKLGYIEDDDLEDHLLDLYEELNPDIEKVLDSYNSHKRSVADYIITNSSDYPGGNYFQVLSSNPVKLRCRMFLGDTNDVLDAYENSLGKMKSIVSAIDKKYDLN